MGNLRLRPPAPVVYVQASTMASSIISRKIFGKAWPCRLSPLSLSLSSLAHFHIRNPERIERSKASPIDPACLYGAQHRCFDGIQSHGAWATRAMCQAVEERFVVGTARHTKPGSPREPQDVLAAADKKTQRLHEDEASAVASAVVAGETSGPDMLLDVWAKVRTQSWGTQGALSLNHPRPRK